MIVTADPRGDFNATSQILRYSALAREVTVPRVISITQTITQAIFSPPPTITTDNTVSMPSNTQQHSQTSRLHTTKSDTTEITTELTRVRAELTKLRATLTAETRRREEAETSWADAEQRLTETEASVREECWNEFESRMQSERHRQTAARVEERERGDAHLDEKIEILTRGVHIFEDEDDSVGGGSMEGKYEELERENDALRQKVRSLEREKDVNRSPSRKLKSLKAKRWVLDDGLGVDGENDELLS